MRPQVQLCPVFAHFSLYGHINICMCPLCLQVRLHTATQIWNEQVEAEARTALAMGGLAGGGAGAGATTSSGRTPGKRNKREMSLAAVVERARNRWE